jgi:hypothetical protein
MGMTNVGITVFVGLPMLCFGMLLGATWTVQALNWKFRRLAAQRRELNKLHLTLISHSRASLPWATFLHISVGPEGARSLSVAHTSRVSCPPASRE